MCPSISENKTEKSKWKDEEKEKEEKRRKRKITMWRLFIIVFFFLTCALGPGGINVDCNIDCFGNHKFGPVLLT